MDPVEAKYIGMCNIGVVFFILITPFYALYCYSNGWLFITYEQFVFAGLLALTFLFNQKGRYTSGLIWFGSILNYHLVILSVAFGWEVEVHYLIFFTAGGAIMLFRRRASYLILPAVLSSLILFYAAYVLSIYIHPICRLSPEQLAATNSVIELTFFLLVVVNALIGRYGSIASEDQLRAEMEKSTALLRQLKVLDRQKTTFFQNISHEFRTPLTLIVGPLENILSEKFGRLGQPLKEQLAIIQRNSLRLLGLINQLLDLSKLDEKKMPIKPVYGNLSGLVSDVVASFKPYAGKLNIALEAPDRFKKIEIAYDPQIMEKVLINLISNALKFTPKGGRVSVSAYETDDGLFGVITVKDSGIGISKKDMPYIFNRFHQVDATTTRDQEGTGIGLNLVKEFVTLHGGKIKVDSMINRGTEFTIMLPKKALICSSDANNSDEQETIGEDTYYYEKTLPENDVEISAQEKERLIAENPANILIIDDNKDMRDYIRQVIGGQYHTIEAKNGEEGLKRAEEIIPDLIISDVMMPNMDGYELCRRINSNDLLKNIPVVLVTARASEEMTIEGLESGAYDYITKPFAPKILLAKINGILLRKEAAEAQKSQDGLTGLLNRSAWEKRVLAEIERNNRYGTLFSIAFIDIDDFKMINDTYGHQTGDMVLKTVSSLIMDNLRASDMTGRIGGEEFAVYFPQTGARAASESIERILSHFRNRNINDIKTPCGFSAGVVEKNPDRELSLQEYLSRADAAMYEVKKSGKGRVAIYDDSSCREGIST